MSSAPHDVTPATGSQPEQFCMGCGYALRGLGQPRCPECGREFDPSDPRTFEIHAPSSRLTRFLRRPPGWPLLTYCALCSFFLMFSVSAPGKYFGWFMLSVFGLLFAGAAYFTRLVGYLAATARRRRDGPTVGTCARWLLPPLMALSSIAVTAPDGPLRLRVRLSRPAMDRLVSTAATLPPGSALPNQRVGLFFAEDIQTYTGGVRFRVPETGFLDSGGFAFSFTDSPPRISEDRYEPLSDHWFIWIEGF